jgi:hypothetical protein
LQLERFRAEQTIRRHFEIQTFFVAATLHIDCPAEYAGGEAVKCAFGVLNSGRLVEFL